MQYLRIFENVDIMRSVLARAKIGILGLAYGDSAPVLCLKPTPPNPKTIPFYIDVRGPVTISPTAGLQMSTDNVNWVDTNDSVLLTGKTYFRVSADQTSPLNPNWAEDDSSDYDIGGNINSLVKVNFENDNNCYSFKSFFLGRTKLKYADDLLLPATTLTVQQCYTNMFQNCTALCAAPALRATTLSQQCYTAMFYGCSALTDIPELPATLLTYGCYGNMFHGCTSLTKAPKLPAIILAGNCYAGMFYKCGRLTKAPALPAKLLAGNCYKAMFQDCTSLTVAPKLPATTLTGGCYTSMFQGCSGLVNAPVLPAPILSNLCYYFMFAGCKQLKYIKCLATDISATNCTGSWLSNVGATGTFVKDPQMTSWPTGNNGIPNNWNILNN